MKVLTPADIKKKFRYDFVSDDILGGFHRARKDGRHFHILPDGRRAYKADYDEVAAFSEGLAVARKDGKFFHILPNGKPAYRRRFPDRVGPFKGYAAKTGGHGEEVFIYRDGTNVEAG